MKTMQPSVFNQRKRTMFFIKNETKTKSDAR